MQFMIDIGFEPCNFDKRADGIWYLRNYKNTVQKVVIGKDRGTMDLLIDFGSYQHQYYPDCYYKTKEDVNEIFKIFKKVILHDLDKYDKEDHVTGYMNENIYYNYQKIADSIKFKPKNINELNEYAIRLKDKAKLSFENYIKQISSLYIIMLLDIYEFSKVEFLYDKCEKYNYRRLFVKKISSYNSTNSIDHYDCEEIIIQPTLEVEKLWNDKIDTITCELFEKDDEELDAFSISNIFKEYRQIANSIKFKPKNIDELNEYAIKLRDDEKIIFKNFVEQISSLYIVLLLDVYDFKKVEPFYDPKEALFMKTPLYTRNFENSLKYQDDVIRIEIINDVTKLYFKHKYKLGHKNLLI